MKGAISYLKELFGLYRLYGRMDLQWFLQDSRNSLILLAVDVVLGVADLAGLMLLAVRFQGVGGFSAREVLFFLAKIVAAVDNEGVDLNEGVGIKQGLQALASGHFALLVLLVDPCLAATESD